MVQYSNTRFRKTPKHKGTNEKTHDWTRGDGRLLHAALRRNQGFGDDIYGRCACPVYREGRAPRRGEHALQRRRDRDGVPRLRRCRREAQDHRRRRLHAVLPDEGLLRRDDREARRGGEDRPRRSRLQVPSRVRDSLGKRRRDQRRQDARQGEERPHRAHVPQPHGRLPVRDMRQEARHQGRRPSGRTPLLRPLRRFSSSPARRCSTPTPASTSALQSSRS